MNLLIVDDSQQMRQMIRSVVSDLADHTYECEDGVDALPAYAKHQPDWVLMDIRMKEMDGLSATRQITQAFPQANIMIVTDYDDAGLRDEAHMAGACGYVLKENLLAIRERLDSGTVRSRQL